MRLAHLVLLVLVSGCSVKFSFGGRPMPLPPTSSAERCYHEQRMELSIGTGELEKWKHEKSTLAGERFRIVNSSVKGVIFYQAGNRISPTRALELLEDAALASAYGTELERLESGKSRHGFRVLLGAGISTAGIGLLALALPTESYELAGAGGLAALVGIGVILTGHRHGEYREKHAIYSTLFIERGMLERLFHAVEAHNRGAASRCGTTGNIDVPMSPGHKKTLR